MLRHRRTKTEIEPAPPTVYWVRDSDGNQRWSVRPLSAEIQALANHNSHLYDVALGCLCNEAPVNFIGTLFLLQQKAKLLPVIQAQENLGAVLPTFHERFNPPFRLLTNVPLYKFGKDTTPQLTNLTAPLVFYKIASGELAGVVLQGPLAGLMLQPLPTAKQPEEGMIINRIWNDQLVMGTDHPYWTPVKDLKSRPYLDTVYRLDREFAAMVNRNWPTHPWSSQIFRQLCHDFNIPINLEHFQTLRAAKDLPKDAVSAR